MGGGGEEEMRRTSDLRRADALKDRKADGQTVYYRAPAKQSSIKRKVGSKILYNYCEKKSQKTEIYLGVC